MPTTAVTADFVRREFEYNRETGVLRRRVARGGAKPGDVAGWMGKNGYRYVSVGNRKYLVHRIIWLWIYGEWPVVTVDHWNRNPLDNTPNNLRDATRRQQSINTRPHKNNTSGHKGVYWHKTSGLWVAFVFRYGKTISLGYYRRKEDAIAARERGEAREYAA
jgi:hypothetical protein